ncbi:MAG: hypothetical protein ACRCYS_10445 [Beijerinckiaceae bacterium]
MTPSELRAAIAGRPQRCTTAWLDINPATLLRYLNGELPVPVQTAMLCDMLAMGELPERFRPRWR